MAKEMSTDNFYRAFEERYRGSRELIKSRLRVYVRFIEPLRLAYAGSKAIDIGCGRGEWLELVNGLGFEGRGVDLDEGMLSVSRAFGLNVECREAVAYLKTLSSTSVAIVSAFHVAEHIEFSDLQALVQEAHRVLLPGGLLILETPNPENIVVAGANFYLDPTHRRPIPPQLLSFLPEYYGFDRVKVLRLQEAPALAQSSALTLLNVLNGVSPDYAVVAQKSGPDEILAATLPTFNEEYGISLETLAEKYEQQRAKMEQALQVRVELVETSLETLAEKHEQQRAIMEQVLQVRVALVETKAHLTEANSQIQQMEAKTQQAEARATQLQSELDAVYAANHHHWQLAETRAQQIEAIYQTYSWRITAPLRRVRSAAGGLTPRAFKPRIKVLLQHTALYIRRRPLLKNAALRGLHYFPRLKARLFRVVAGMAVQTPTKAQTVGALTSIKMMMAIERLNEHTQTDSVVFLEIPHDLRQ